MHQWRRTPGWVVPSRRSAGHCSPGANHRHAEQPSAHRKAGRRLRSTAICRTLRFVSTRFFRSLGSSGHVRSWLLKGLARPAPVPDAIAGHRQETGAGAHDAGEFRPPAAGDWAADSAIIRRVETLPAAFVNDAEGLVRHIQRGSGHKDREQAEATVSALIGTSFDAVPPLSIHQGGRPRTVRLNVDRLPRMSEPGRGINAP